MRDKNRQASSVFFRRVSTDRQFSEVRFHLQDPQRCRVEFRGLEIISFPVKPKNKEKKRTSERSVWRGRRRRWKRKDPRDPPPYRFFVKFRDEQHSCSYTITLMQPENRRTLRELSKKQQRRGQVLLLPLLQWKWGSRRTEQVTMLHGCMQLHKLNWLSRPPRFFRFSFRFFYVTLLPLSLFFFFLSQQRAWRKMMMHLIPAPPPKSFTSILFFDFRDLLSSLVYAVFYLFTPASSSASVDLHTLFSCGSDRKHFFCSTATLSCSILWDYRKIK